jgi:predicted transporter
VLLMIDKKAFLVVGFLFCADALIFIFSKEQGFDNRLSSVLYFHGVLFLLSFVLLFLFRYLSGRELEKAPFTENEKKVVLFGAFNFLVPMIITLILY